METDSPRLWKPFHVGDPNCMGEVLRGRVYNPKFLLLRSSYSNGLLHKWEKNRVTATVPNTHSMTRPLVKWMNEIKSTLMNKQQRLRPFERMGSNPYNPWRAEQGQEPRIWLQILQSYPLGVLPSSNTETQMGNSFLWWVGIPLAYSPECHISGPETPQKGDIYDGRNLKPLWKKLLY